MKARGENTFSPEKKMHPFEIENIQTQKKH